MYAKPKCPPLIKFVVVIVIALELVALGSLLLAHAEGSGEQAPDQAAPVAQTDNSQNAPADQGDSAAEGADKQEDGQAEPEPVKLTITFAGDCTLGTDENFDKSRNFTSRWDKEDGNAAYFLQNVADLFKSDDLTVVNMEGVLTDSTDRVDKQFAFKGPAEYAKILSAGNVEMASVANNHSADYGEDSLQDTIDALDAEGVESFGYERIAYRDIKGVKVALIGAYALNEEVDYVKEMTDNIAQAREKGAQLVLVYVHWGIEREYTPTQDQMDMGHAAIDAGADLVVGGHPHVIQGWEVYQGRYIVYSLGNFCFGGNSNPDDKDCMIFQQTFTVTGDDVAKDDVVDFIACSVSSSSERNTYQPTIAEGEEKERIEKKIQDSTDEIAEMAANAIDA